MIEATCAACGTVNRMTEADVPQGAKYVTCASCKSRVVIPGATTGSVPRVPTGALPKPQLPSTPGAPGDVLDLPVPKRQSALAGADPSRPAPKSALSLDIDLPAPKSAFSSGAAPALDLDDLLLAPGGGEAAADLPAPKASGGIVDLPAPKTSGGIVDLPAPKVGGVVDVPAPKVGGIADLPAPKAKSGIPDLPVPKAKSGIPDLPAPKAKSGIPDLPVPKAKSGIPDLPAPKAKSSAPPDLPAPKGRALPQDLPAPKRGVPDLPAPKAGGGVADLPTPKAGGGVVDLPTPKAGGGVVDLPTPKAGGGVVDLPTPKAGGGVVDLPTPKSTGPDLPAPKGFFDGLPQPAKAGRPDLPAPKGFFDDLPQPAKSTGPDLPAPKGFFDDLPQPASSNATDLPAPKGFFDDLPQPAGSSSGARNSDSFGQGAALDLELAPGSVSLELDTGPAPAAAPPAASNLDLGPPAGGDAFDNLALAEPTRSTASPEAEAAGIKIGTPKGPVAAPPAPAPAALARKAAALRGTEKAAELQLETEDLHKSGPAATPKLAPKQPVAAAPVKANRTRLVAVGAIGVAIAGVGGVYAYKRHAAAQHRREEIAAQLAKARAAFDDTDLHHWQRAAAAARAALVVDPKQPDALGLLAESLLADGLQRGSTGELSSGRKAIADALGAGALGPSLSRAQALGSIANNQGAAAVTKLKPLLAATPNDPYLHLYAGWAQLANHDDAAAIKALDPVVGNAHVKEPALVARGRAKLALGQVAAAHDDFAAALAIDKDDVGAMVDLAEASPASQSTQRESDLLAVLARKDIKSADPRAVVRAWRLAADVARQGGRYDEARDRYNKALALAPLDVPALTGLAQTQMADGKLAEAQEAIQKAVTQAPDDVDAQLVLANLWIKTGRVTDAQGKLAPLADHKPPLLPLQKAQLEMTVGKLRAAQGQDDAAADAYVLAAQAAGDLDLGPTMAAVTELDALADRKASSDPQAAAGYRQRAEQLLSKLADRAQDDPQLSMTIGLAYMQAGNLEKAEDFLRRSVEMRDDVDARLALAEVQQRLGHAEDAIESLKGAFAKDPSRADVALQLAETYEAAGRDADAADAYSKMLAAKDVPVAARVHAGLFFDRRGEHDKAAAQADPILAIEPDNPGGHYLKGEGLLDQSKLDASKLDAARKEMQAAVDGEPEAIYLDGQGRAAEASALATGDPQFQALAIRAYERAAQTDPKMVNPQAGLGRLYVASKQMGKAITPLVAANKLAPDDPAVMLDLGLAYQTLGQFDVARQWLQASIKAKPIAQAYFALGQVDVELNRAPEALKSFTEAAKLGTDEEKAGNKVPWLTEAWFRVGRAHRDMNDDCGAKHAYQTFMARQPPDGGERQEATLYLATTARGCP
jgi:tetratricopeptide (TPR) repeat protein/DNA-directed RNA polymerase subunit RPC12/RpoP